MYTLSDVLQKILQLICYKNVHFGPSLPCALMSLTVQVHLC